MFGNKLSKIEKFAEKGQEEKLAPLCKDKDASVRVAAIDALGKCKGDVAFNSLIELIRDPELEIRLHAVKSLGMMKLPKARTHLLHLMETDHEPAMHDAIDEALKSISVQI